VDEVIVRVMRALACFSRIEMLRLMIREGELTPRALSEKLGVSPAAVSLHLRRLESAGLICRRPSGRRCYCIAKSAYARDTLSGKLAAWLKRTLASAKKPTEPTHRRRQHRADRNEEGSTAEAVFDAATAFTNLRRLRIQRRLGHRKGVLRESLSRALHMSPSALCRHLRKLERRGYVVISENAEHETCRLASRFKTPFHAELLRIVKSVRQRPRPVDAQAPLRE